MDYCTEKMLDAEKRIDNIDFLKPLTIDYSLNVLPQIQQIIEENRELLYELRKKHPITKRLKMSGRGHVLKNVQKTTLPNDQHAYVTLKKVYYPFYDLKRKAYEKGLYKTIGQHSRVCLKNVRSKIEKQIEDIMMDRNEHDVGGSHLWYHYTVQQHPIYEIKETVLKDVSAYMWHDGTNDKNESNPYEIFIRFYEMGVIPFGIQNVRCLYPDINKINSKINKFIVEFPLDKNQIKSDVEHGRNPRKLAVPKLIDSYVLSTFADGDSSLEYMRYWSEDYYELRPLLL